MRLRGAAAVAAGLKELRLCGSNRDSRSRFTRSLQVSAFSPVEAISNQLQFQDIPDEVAVGQRFKTTSKVTIPRNLYLSARKPAHQIPRLPEAKTIHHDDHIDNVFCCYHNIYISGVKGRFARSSASRTRAEQSCCSTFFQLPPDQPFNHPACQDFWTRAHNVFQAHSYANYCSRSVHCPIQA